MHAQANHLRTSEWACPFCYKGDPEYSPEKLQFRCQRCCALGNALTIVRKVLSETAFAKLKATFQGKPVPHPEKLCPQCRSSITFFNVQADRKTFLGLCKPCNWVWSETVDFLNAFSRQGPSVLEKAKIRATNMEREEAVVGETYNFLDLSEPHLVNHVETNVNNAVGPVIEHDTQKPAYHGFLIVFACALVTFLVNHVPKLAPLFFFDTRHPFSHLGLPALLSGFMHGDLAHLIGNAIPILGLCWILENELERPRDILWIFLGSVVVGNVLQAMFGPHDYVIGSSGGARGLLAFYCVRFPYARFNMVQNWGNGNPFRHVDGPIYSVLRISAPAFLTFILFVDFVGGWTGKQIFDLVHDPRLVLPGNVLYTLLLSMRFLSTFMPSFIGTACFAHLGGAVFGLLYATSNDVKLKKEKVRVSIAPPSRRRDGSRRNPIPSEKISGFPNGIGPGDEHLKVYCPPVRKEKI